MNNLNYLKRTVAYVFFSIYTISAIVILILATIKEDVCLLLLSLLAMCLALITLKTVKKPVLIKRYCRECCKTLDQNILTASLCECIACGHINDI